MQTPGEVSVKTDVQGCSALLCPGCTQGFHKEVWKRFLQRLVSTVHKRRRLLGLPALVGLRHVQGWEDLALIPLAGAMGLTLSSVKWSVCVLAAGEEESEHWLCRDAFPSHSTHVDSALSVSAALRHM